MLKDRKSLRVKYLIPAMEALILLHPFLLEMWELIHPDTVNKLDIFLIVSMVSSLFHVRSEVVLGCDS